MKNKVLLVFAALFTHCMVWGQKLETDRNQYVKVLSVSTEGLTLEININDFNKTPEMIDGKEYFRPWLQHESSIMEKGYPELPKIVRSISIPPTSGITGRILASEYKDMVLPVIPSKGHILRKINPKDVPYTFAGIYSKNEFYPANSFEFGDPYILRNVRGSDVTIYPFAYNPVIQTFRIYTKLVIKISFDGTNEKNMLTRSSEERNRHFEFIYKDHFLNYVSPFADINDSDESAGSHGRIISDNGKMLIITYDNFYNDVLVYAAHKEIVGIPTQVVKMSTVGSTAIDVKNYIQNIYNQPNSNLSFVLLVGDDAQIPSFDPLNLQGLSDPTYSLMNGGNYPSLVVGRFPATSNAELATMITRSIVYDTMVDPPAPNSWFHKGIGIASDLNFKPDPTSGYYDHDQHDHLHIREIRDVLLNSHYTTVDELYDGSHGPPNFPNYPDSIGDPTAKMVSRRVNSGVSIINYAGHGTASIWETSEFADFDVKKLTNDNKYPFIFSVACQVGNFKIAECFAEAWLRAKNSTTGNPTGAIAFYGSSANQLWNPPMIAQDQFNISLASTTGFKTFGVLCYKAAATMIRTDTDYGFNEFLYWNLFGDPSTIVIPHRLNIPIITGPNTLCNEGSFQLVNHPSGTLQWSITGPFTLNSTTANPVTVTKTGSGALDATLTAKINGNIVAIKRIIPLSSCPPVVISGATLICYNSPKNFSANNWQAGYYWDSSPNINLNSCTANPTQASASAGSHGAGWISVKDINNMEVKKFNVWVGAPSIYISGQTSVYTNEWKSYEAIATNSLSAPTSYEWYLSPMNWSYLNNYGYWANINFSPSGYYQISSRATNACGVGTNFAYLPVNVSDGYKSYPNPASDILNIEIDANNVMPGKTTPVTDIRLYDGQGNMVRQTFAHGGTVQFNVSNLPNGIYYLHIYDGVNNIPVIHQIVVER